MRDGDLLYCKETYIHIDEFGNKEEWLIEGKLYKVVYEAKYDLYSIIDNEGDHNNTLTLPYYLQKYFYTDNEYRKYKLQKIYESTL